MDIFVNLSLILLLVVVISALMRLLKQPLIMGYILTGIIAGPYFFGLLHESTTVATFAEMGVALLLFTVGLHLNPRVINEVGKVSLITGVGQVCFTTILGFIIGTLLGFSVVASLYIAVAISFSSTIIIMKILSDKGDTGTVYGKISIGFLIVQDLIAVFILMAVSSLAGTANEVSISNLIFRTISIGSLAILILIFLSVYVLPGVTKRVAKSQEFLLLFSLGWCLILASLFKYLNFSLEIGALLAGMALSINPYANEISSRMKPIRDFFIVLFFIIIGAQMSFGDVANNVVPIVLFSGLILIGNPLIVMSLMGFLGYTKRTSFFSGLTVAQISEFSIILISLGISVGHLNSEMLSIITVIGLITIAGSTYSMTYSDKIYPLISNTLGIFERKKLKERVEKEHEKEYDSILFGYNRIGFGILRALKSIRKKYLVVDYNPDTIANLKKVGVPAIYGDAYDEEFLDELPLDKVELVNSTIPDLETNMLLIENIKRRNPKAIIIVRARQLDEALLLYKKGANYVLTPHFLGGDYLARMIENIKTNGDGYENEKEKHMKLLKEIIKKGQHLERGDI